MFYMHIQDDFGESPLIIAASHGHTLTCQVLLEHRAHVDYRNKVRLLYSTVYWFSDLVLAVSCCVLLWHVNCTCTLPCTCQLFDIA